MLLDLLSETGCPLDEEMTETLAGLKGTSKAAKLARDILKLEQSLDQALYQEALADALATRLERAEAWKT